MSDIAVVMPARDEERFVERALRSVAAQSLPRDAFEIIVVDDGSVDATREIVHGFGEDVHLLVNEGQLGLPASINRGIRAARSRFVVRIDADDYVHQDFLRVLHLHLELNPYMDAIACDYFTVDESEEHLEHRNCLKDPIGCGIMFRKERLIDIGLYDETFLMAEDLDLRLRFEKHWTIHRCELPLYRYRQHDANMTRAEEEHLAHRERARLKNTGS